MCRRRGRRRWFQLLLVTGKTRDLGLLCIRWIGVKLGQSLLVDVVLHLQHETRVQLVLFRVRLKIECRKIVGFFTNMAGDATHA